MKAYQINIQGRVQGVGYRYFAEKNAYKNNVLGYVKNLPDGSVEILAQGEETAVNDFIDELKRGPSFARVIDVVVTLAPVDSNLSDFSVKY